MDTDCDIHYLLRYLSLDQPHQRSMILSKLEGPNREHIEYKTRKPQHKFKSYIDSLIQKGFPPMPWEQAGASGQAAAVAKSPEPCKELCGK